MNIIELIAFCGILVGIYFFYVFYMKVVSVTGINTWYLFVVILSIMLILKVIISKRKG